MGPSGRLLWESVSAALRDAQIDLPLEDLGATNVVACQPPPPSGRAYGQREPTDEEANACSARLQLTLRLAQPEVIVLLGTSARKHAKIAMAAVDIKPPTLEIGHPSYWARSGGEQGFPCREAVKKMTRFFRQHLA